MGDVTTILGGSSGPWRVTSMAAVTGAGLPPVDAIAVAEAPPAADPGEHAELWGG